MNYLVSMWLYRNHKDDALLLSSPDAVKRYVYETTKKYITNEKAYIAAMKKVNWEYVYKSLQ